MRSASHSQRHVESPCVVCAAPFPQQSGHIIDERQIQAVEKALQQERRAAEKQQQLLEQELATKVVWHPPVLPSPGLLPPAVWCP